MTRTAIVPGSFRPPTDLHMKMIRHYAESCDAVAVIVSNPSKSLRKTSTGMPISAETSRKILEDAISDSGLGENVRVFISENESPVKDILGILGDLEGQEIVLGVGRKDDPSGRFAFLEKVPKGPGVRIVPPEETAFDAGDGFSAGDLRERIGDTAYLKAHLPQCLSEEHMSEAVRLLQEECGVGILRENRSATDIFGELVSESSIYGAGFSGIFEDEETPFREISMSDGSLEKAKCRMSAWNMHVGEKEDATDSGEAVNPKNCPEKAVDLEFEFPGGEKVEIFLGGKDLEWDSSVVSGEKSGKLSPDQMGEFFGTKFYKRLYNRLNEMWPCSDEQFGNAIRAINEKRLKLDRIPEETLSEDDSGKDDSGKRWFDKDNSRKKNVAGRQVTTRSGRKIVTFSDFGVKHDDNEAYFVWPELDKEWKWSQWQDWTKISPLMRMRFRHQGKGDYVYGISLSPFAEDDENRGFRAYNLTLEPKLQYLTPEETRQMMDLSIVQKFFRNALKRLSYFMSIPDEKIVELVDAPDRVQIDEVRKTKHVIKNTMKAIRQKRADSYIY